MPVAAEAVLQLWERGAPLDRPARAVLLASAADPERTREQIAALPVGQRDERLLQLRETLAGASMEAVTSCPSCGEDIEFQIDVPTLLAASARAVDPEPVEVDGWQVGWRPVCTDDLVAAAEAPDAAAAESVLLERCTVITSTPDGADPDRLPAPVRGAVADAIAAADPLAEVLVDLTCPGCATPVSADVEIAALVWDELADRAQRVLWDVHVLAHTYGWTESEVLALSDSRRRAYLRLAGGGAP